MSPEQEVMAIRPGARLHGGHHGKVWIQDGEQMLGDVCYLGTRERRRSDAWASALKALVKA